MLNITVLENWDTEKMVEIEMEGEASTRKMGIKELKSWIDDATKEGATVKVSFEEPTEIEVVTIEEYDGEYDLYINRYTYEAVSDFEYEDELVKTYKQHASAVKQAQKIAKERDAYLAI